MKKKIMTEVMIKRKIDQNEGWWQDRENECRERGWRMMKKNKREKGKIGKVMEGKSGMEKDGQRE